MGAKSKLKSASELGLSRTNYAFVGWATKSDATEAEYNDAAEVTLTADLTLYALWAENVCTVTFNANGGSITTATQTVKLGAKSKLKSATELGLNRTGYEFAGWATKSDATEAEYADAAEVTLTDNLTLFALWIKLCTITFDANGGSITTAEQTVKAGEKATLKSAGELGLSRANYAFVGWATKSDATEAEYTDAAEATLTSDLTLFALWIKLCTITFDANGGNITIATQVVKAGVPTKLKSAAELGLYKTNYKFIGWNKSTAASSSSGGLYKFISLFRLTSDYNDEAEVTLTDDITLYAIWNELPVNEQPLTLEFIKSGTITITAMWSSLKYSINGGDLTGATDSITVAAGDKVCFYAQKSENGTYCQIINCDADCYIYGNIMSLVTLTENGDWNPLETTLFDESSFRQLFYENCHIKNHASKKLILPATKLTRECYCEMFCKCTSLTAAPELPAETLAEDCYCEMFYECTSLTTAPELKATTLAKCCYETMFCGCTSLTTVPSLPAETLADWCYAFMFYGCTTLTTAPELKATTLAKCCCTNMFAACTSLATAPELKATTLAESCYNSMFSRCTSLTTAPELPAETLADYCYAYMFEECTSLNYVKCLATNVSSTNFTSSWLYGVSTTGKFVKAMNMTSWERGNSGIPSGWTVEDAE